LTFDKQKTLGDLKRRMQSVETLTWSIHFRTKWDGAPIAVHIDGKVSLYGDLNVIINPMWEVGLVHCRALLEFLGLCEKAGSLDQIEKRRKRDDIGVEHFDNANGCGPLPKVSLENAISSYPDDPDKAKEALHRVFRLTNKGLAHVTSGMKDDPADFELIEIASRGVTELMVGYFYEPGGLPPPPKIISTRSKDE